MSTIVVKNVLDAIHYNLEHNGYHYSEKQIARADGFIIPFIDEVNISEDEFKVKTLRIPKLVHDRRISDLIVKYFAFIEDNMALYNELLEEDYLLCIGSKIKYFALDRTLTGNFKKNEYKNILLKNEAVISSFYYSLRGLPQEKREKYSREFSDIVHADHTTLNVGDERDDGINHYGFLTVRNIEIYGKEFLLKLTKEQREIINNIHSSISEEDVMKVKELINKYPDYKNTIPLNSCILRLFTIDEIYSMTIKDYILYDAAIKNNVVKRVKELLEEDPSFDCPKEFIKEEIFRILDNQEILELSDDAKDKISKVKIPEMDNVLVMPFSKINRIVLLDKASRKIDSITGGHSK